MSRVRELSFRMANAALIAALNKLHRTFKIETTYKIGADGAAALFEGSWFAYSPRNFGCTGNIDLVPEAENATRAELFARVRDGEVFYDIGAHGGVYTITLLKEFPGLRVHSFEPQPEELLTNLRLNDLPDENVHRIAVGESAGTVRMTTNQRSSNHVSDEGDVVVPLMRLDDYVRDKWLPPPDWIKIDIEGMELPALRGAESLIRHSVPTVICEINHLFGRFGTTLSAFLGYMTGLGYTTHRLTDRGLEPVEGSPSELADLGFSADNNFWFVPTKQLARDGGAQAGQ